MLEEPRMDKDRDALKTVLPNRSSVNTLQTSQFGNDFCTRVCNLLGKKRKYASKKRTH